MPSPEGTAGATKTRGQADLQLTKSILTEVHSVSKDGQTVASRPTNRVRDRQTHGDMTSERRSLVSDRGKIGHPNPQGKGQTKRQS